MKLATFTYSSGVQQIGALMKDGCTIAILKSEELAMDGQETHYFADMLSFLQGGLAVRERAQAEARPSPRDAPVSRATFPLRFICTCVFCFILF
jgi:hypothetical protein